MATYVNPANLPLNAGVETRVQVLYTGEDAQLPMRGYSLDLALPFWIFGTGLRIDWMDPTDRSPAPFTLGGKGERYNWLRWGNGIALGDFASVGVGLNWSNANVPQLHGFFSVGDGADDAAQPVRVVLGGGARRQFAGK